MRLVRNLILPQSSVLPAPNAIASPQTRQRLLLLMDHSLDFLEFVSEGGRVQSVSSAITDLAGYLPSDLVGRRFAEFIHPDDRGLAGQSFNQVLATGHAGPVQMRYQRKNGTFRTVQITARNFLADPLIGGILVLTRDVTDQVAAEDALSRANTELHRLSQELMVVQELERAHLARELHDDVQQALAGLRYSMAAAGFAEVPSCVIITWDATVAEIMEKLRRLTLRLRPPALDRLGLQSALEDYVARERTRTATRITIDISSKIGRLATEVELSAFRIIQEALSNSLKHAQATAITIAVLRAEGRLFINVSDNGVGFDVEVKLEHAGRSGRIGLQSMCERAAMTGGSATITSIPGKGTIVHVELPCGPDPLSAPNVPIDPELPVGPA